MEHLGHFDFKETFTASEAASLMMGRTPSDFYLLDIEQTKPIYERMERDFQSALLRFRAGHAACQSHGRTGEYQQSPRDLISVELDKFRRAEADGQNTVQFDEWMNSPAAEFGYQHFSREELHRWIIENRLPTKYEFIKNVDAGLTPEDRPVSTRERGTLLSLVIGMAMAGWRYDPAASKSPAINEITSDLNRLGLNISDDTIRKYLKEAAHTVFPDKLRKS